MLGFPPHHRWSRVAIAFLAILLAGLFRWFCAPLLGYHSGLILFIPAVMAATWYGGWWPGVVAMALGAMIGESSVAQPAGIFSWHNHETVRMAMFLLVGLQIAWGTDLLHRRTREAQAASHAKDHFISILSHELRTPLTPALAAAADLTHDPNLPEAVRQQAGVIHRNILLEVRLINDLLDMTRIRKGKLQLKRETVELGLVLQEAMTTCHEALAAKHLDLQVHTEGGPHFVDADPARLQQVFWNLLRNAAKFTPENGSITIQTTRGQDDMVAIYVTDTGIGIAPAVLPRIFESFEQGDDSITRRFGGLGLGLAITRSLVESHGGTITASSDGVGRGATFVVRLPVAPAPQPSSQNAPQAPSPTWHALRILYVEDHADTLQVMTRLLSRFGHQVTPASTVQEALAHAATQSFDLIISDMALPDGSGTDLMRALATAGHAIKGIAVTGSGREEDIHQTHRAGFCAHLTKPIDVAELQQTIQTVGRPPC